ncbi:hypothetical protein NQ315_011837 [Exocentrus adspersus]|uniref:PLAT domain-containing protein n=1 Tax=Exocentrus adspersus TaxID=1586481 RepID=A0AAV8W0Q7_9CUCU|nr:hypothetical protein NQ315_011837 [Exocentrus adspersus]
MNGFQFSRREENRIEAKYVQGGECQIDKVQYEWTVNLGNGTEIAEKDYKHKNVYVMRPYSIGAGSHTITVSVKETHKDKNETKAVAMGCGVVVIPEPPLVEIKGGSQKTAQSGESLLVDGGDCVDMDVPPGQPGNLQYKWECTVEDAETDFCTKDLGTGKTITIPAKDAVDGSTYIVTLSVKSADSKWESTQQIVQFTDDVSSVRNIVIKCLKNCPPVTQKTNSEERTILEAKCERNCAGLTKDMYEWTIDVPGFNYETDTQTGQNTDLFSINENVLRQGRMYHVAVTIKNNVGGATTNLEVHKPPRLELCKVKPPAGVAMTTQFKVECHYQPGQYMFEIFSSKDDIDVIVNKGVMLEVLSFTLSPNSRVKLRIIDMFRFSDTKTLDVDVSASYCKSKKEVSVTVAQVSPLVNAAASEEQVEKDLVDKYSTSVDSLMRSKDFEKVLQVGNNLAGELEEVKKSGKDKVADKFYSKLMECMNDMPMDTGLRARQMGSLAAKITEAYASKPDPSISALATKVCKKSAEVMLKRLKKNRFPGSFWEETKESTETLSRCSQASVEPNEEVLESEVQIPEVTTEFPLLDLPAIIENYPDYVDDQNTSKAMNNFDKSSNNLIQICYLNSKKMAVTMSSKEQTKFVTSKALTVTCTLRIGSDVPETSIESHQVTLVPSSDFTSSRSAVHITMCTCPKNIFWWLLKERVFTSTAIVQFNVDEERVTEFHRPFTLSFKTKYGIADNIKEHEGTAPRTVNGSSARESDMISVHRIDVRARESFVVEFTDLPYGAVLDVMVADFHKPSFEEFQEKAKRVDSWNNRLFIGNYEYYNSWHYLAVLPNPETSGEEVWYKYQVYALSCYRWDDSKAKWMFACGSTEDSTTSLIICQCYHSSAFIAKLINNEVRDEEPLIEEFELEPQASYIVLASVVVVYFLYCIFFAWFSINAKKDVMQETVYFLSDVPSTSRYGYVLIVKTGNKTNAGTTSNVTVKIYGTKSQSKASTEHVLNYPDPDKKFLQKNEDDWFFLATESYLGDVEKIELWFDSLGYRPSWFCNEIEIFDVQMHKHWSFKINRWFELLRDDEAVYTAYPEKPSEVTEKKRAVVLRVLKRFLDSFRGAHMWDLVRSEDQAIPRMKRLHVMYSIFLTTYLLGLLFYGCPRLENSDSLSYTLDYQIDRYVVLYTFGSLLVTFAMHFPVVWFFTHPKDNVLGKDGLVLKKYRLGTNVLCWSFLIGNIVVSMTLLVVLGFWVPYVTGLLWLTCVIGSLVIYIFVMENIVRLIFNFTTDQKERVELIFERIKSSLAVVEKQRVMLYQTFGAVVLRPLFHHLYKPLGALKIKEQKYWATIKEKLWEIVEDLIMITIYVVLLYIVILLDKDVMAYMSHLEVGELLDGTHSRTKTLDDTLNRKEIPHYLKDTLIISMQSLQWYGKYVARNPGMTVDFANKYLGIARLRQHRADAMACEEDYVNKTVCYEEFRSAYEYANFSEGWKKDEPPNRYARMDTVWDYTGQLAAGTVPYSGSISRYPGGGYVATLGRTLQNSITNLNYLLRNKWIDEATRAVFVEFLIYNPGTNLFDAVRILFELSATGYVEKTLDVHTARLLFIKEQTGVMIWIVLSCFVVMLILLIIKLTYRLVRKRKVLLKDIWHVMDICIVLMSLTCIGLYVARSDLVGVFLDMVENAKNNEFVNYFHLMYAEKSLTMLAALLVFLATLRLWKLMRFMLIVRVVERTLLYSSKPLLGLFLYQVIILWVCSLLGMLKYGDHAEAFKGLVGSLSNLLTASLSLNEHFDFEAIRGVGHFVYIVFNFVMLGIYTTYVAIITMAYSEAQFFYSNDEDYTVVDYLKEQFRYYTELAKVKLKVLRLRGGIDAEGRKVFPKPEEFRYASCMTLPSNKMQAMNLVARCVVRNMKTEREARITDKDAELIKRTVVSLIRKDTARKDIFFKSNIQGEKTKLVDDQVMQRMARIIDAFLMDEEERSQRRGRGQLYKKIVESHEQKLKDMGDTLNVVLNILKIVNFDS